MLRAKDGDFFITDWLRNRNTLEFIGIWGKEYYVQLEKYCWVMLGNFNTSKKLSSHMSEVTGHGWVEKRESVVTDTKLLEQEGPGLKRITKVDLDRTENSLTAKESIYYLSSEEMDDAEYFANKVRGRWGIENNLHRLLDVTFREDRCRVRAGNGAQNLSAIRKYALELLKGHEDKLSIKRRRKKCMLNLEYLPQILNGG